VAVDPWSGTLDATNFGPTCYQTYINPILQNLESEEANGNVSEDCLTVDIYIPRNSTREEMGILYWIHGGGYQSGDVQYYSGVEQAVEYGNIVVLVQYRLGIMGFFHYADSNGITHGGNYGLADMALGVQFIAENAANLGGDIEHIVINGESAGSGSVMALLLHDDTASLISGALAQSGGTPINFLYGTNDDSIVKIVCDAVNQNASRARFGCDSSQDIDAIISDLKTAEPRVLYQNAFGPSGFDYQWLPIPHDGVFYPTNVYDRYLNGDLNTGFELHISFNSYEGSLTENFYPPDVPVDQSIAFISDIFRFNETLEVVNYGLETSYSVDSWQNKIKNEFISEASAPEIDSNVEYAKFLANQMVGDIGFILPGILDAKLYSQAGVNTYVYYLDFDGDINFVDPVQDASGVQWPASANFGLAHGSELIYSFGAHRNPDYGTRRPWEAQMANFLGGQIDKIINGEIESNNAANSLPYGSEARIAIIRNTADGVELDYSTGDYYFQSEQAIQAWKTLGGYEAGYQDGLADSRSSILLPTTGFSFILFCFLF